MTTPPLDTPVETLEQIAERFAHNHALKQEEPQQFERLRSDVLSALRNERETCAKLLDVRVAEISNYQTRPYRVARRELEAAARAIREGR